MWITMQFGQRADVAAVVGLAAGVPRLARPVAVLDVVERIVVVVEEVPADHVVDEPVRVVVIAVAERDQDVLRVEQVGRPHAEPASLRGVALHARVAGEVDHVEHAVPVRVVLRRVGGAVLAAFERSRAVRVRRRHLAPGDARLAAQVEHRAAVVPLDARVEDGDGDVGTAGRGCPREVVVRRGGVDQVSAAHPVQLAGVGVDRHVPGLLVGRVHPGLLRPGGELARPRVRRVEAVLAVVARVRSRAGRGRRRGRLTRWPRSSGPPAAAPTATCAFLPLLLPWCALTSASVAAGRPARTTISRRPPLRLSRGLVNRRLPAWALLYTCLPGRRLSGGRSRPRSAAPCDASPRGRRCSAPRTCRTAAPAPAPSSPRSSTTRARPGSVTSPIRTDTRGCARRFLTQSDRSRPPESM